MQPTIHESGHSVTRQTAPMIKNIIETGKVQTLAFKALLLVTMLVLQSCAVPAIYYSDDRSGIDFEAVVATFPEYRNAALPQQITQLTLQNSRLEADRLRNTALSSPKPDSTTTSSYLVGTGDILYIVVWDHPELSITDPKALSEELRGSVVSSEGEIFYPYVGNVNVIGLTVDQIREKLTRLLSVTIEKPQLEVRVSEYRSQKAFVGGEVLTPGTQIISDVPLTLIDAINRAGGATEAANLGRATLTRNSKTYVLDLNELLITGNKALNITLLDGDVLTIPDIRDSKYYVLGDVENPEHKEMENSSRTLSAVIQDVGGIKTANKESTGNPAQIFVLRGTEKGTLVFHVDQSAANSLIVSNNFEVIADDIVYVSNARRSNWNLVYQQIVEYAGQLDNRQAL